MCGHSIGACPALYTAGALSLVDLLSLIGGRARLLEQKVPPHHHCMPLVRASEEKFIDLISAKSLKCEVSCVNNDSTTVVSSKIGAIEQLEIEARGLQTTTERLGLPYVYHSSQMDPVLGESAKITHRVTLHPLQLGFVSPLKKPLLAMDAAFSINYFADHFRELVKLRDAIRSTESLLQGELDWVGVGPGSACITMI